MLLELRVDAWKLCQQCRRPEPRSAEDIGTWYVILEIISVFCVLVNSALVAFTGDNAINYPWYSRVWIFFGMSVGILLVKQYIAATIPDVPEEVEIQLKRNKFFLDKVLYSKPDDDDDVLMSSSRADNKYIIRINDDDPL
ncbi:hypothetical protein EON65_07515 [archaeon]|nr:MAG: hypothetical protein EON65_07515 [archaeon]